LENIAFHKHNNALCWSGKTDTEHKGMVHTKEASSSMSVQTPTVVCIDLSFSESLILAFYDLSVHKSWQFLLDIRIRLSNFFTTGLDLLSCCQSERYQ